ncbi:MAG: helix-turn-helix domain-containing protein [Acidobacteria bacterium]|nr:helix-turn-helix domain-containing protein [Acidobacteriota bacterium]
MDEGHSIRHHCRKQAHSNNGNGKPYTQDKTRFAMAPEDLLKDRLLSLGARVIFCLLVCCRNRVTGQCNPSEKTLAGWANCSVRTVQRYIGELEEAGRVQKQVGLNGKTNNYVLLNTCGSDAVAQPQDTATERLARDKDELERELLADPFIRRQAEGMNILNDRYSWLAKG